MKKLFCALLLSGFSLVWAQVTPGPIRDLTFRGGGITTNIKSFEGERELFTLTKNGDVLTLDMTIHEYTCPDTLDTRTVFAEGDLSVTGFNNDNPVHFTLLWKTNKGKVIVQNLEPRTRIVKLMEYTRTQTSFLEETMFPGVFSWPAEFRGILFRETITDLTQRVAFRILNRFTAPLSTLESDIFFSTFNGFACEIQSATTHASATFKCGGQTVSVGTGTSGGFCVSYDDHGGQCWDGKNNAMLLCGDIEDPTECESNGSGCCSSAGDQCAD